MALDEPGENDFTYADDGVRFAIEKDLFERVKPIRVDYVESARGSGFTLDSNLQGSAGCGASCEC
jgi:Fe-S cluster assembly iron-binding protein IscA